MSITLFCLAITCEGNRVYDDCGSACPKMCDNLMTSDKCVADCVDGCHCPKDLYYDKGKKQCLPQNKCSCYREGVPYPHGYTRKVECEDW